MTVLPLPSDCIALEELPNSESPQGVLKELLGSIQHPYIYPTLDLGFLHSEPHHYACLVMPFNPKGSLKELIYKVRTYILSCLKHPTYLFKDSMERIMEQEECKKGYWSSNVTGSTLGSSDTRSSFVPERSRNSIAWPSAQRECNPSKWSCKVR